MATFPIAFAALIFQLNFDEARIVECAQNSKKHAGN